MRRLPFLLAVLAVSAASGSAAAETAPRRSTVLLMGKRAGTQSCVTRGRETRCSFSFDDRGRGPKLEALVVAGSGSLPVRVEVKGSSYLKAPVDELFAAGPGGARWRSAADAGERPGTRGAFYLPFDAVPELDAFLVQALREAPGNALPLLPSGEARIAARQAVEVSAEGRTARVTMFVVSGIGFEPLRVFVDEEGELFATGGSWLLTVRKGWEAAAPTLLALQARDQSEWSARLARDLARRPAGPLVFRDVGLFDADSASVRRHQSVVVAGNRIASVGPAATTPVPEGAEVVDGAGRTLLPGLWDMHVHLASDVDGLLFLASGVTSVRDLGNDLPDVTARGDRFAAGQALGPRLLTSVLVDGPGPFAGPTRFLVSTPEEGRAALDACVSAGCTGLKIYSSVDPALVPPLVREAHERGIRASGHVPAFMTAQQAVRAGYDEIHHANFLFLNFLFDTVKDTRTPERFTAVAENAASLDLDSPAVRSFLRELRLRGVAVDPTAVAFEELFTNRPGRLPEAWAPVADRLPPQVKRSLLAGGLPVPEGGDARYRASYDAVLRMVRTLHETGVRIVAGTDGMAGFTLPRELELYVRAGIPAAEVLQIATLGAASVARRADELGTIAPGKLADLVLVDGNPAERISDVRKVVLVVKDGAIHDPAALLRPIGVAP